MIFLYKTVKLEQYLLVNIKNYKKDKKMINPFKSKELVTGALAGRNLRNQLINANLANVDTPFYKARDIEFETALVNRANEIFKKK